MWCKNIYTVVLGLAVTKFRQFIFAGSYSSKYCCCLRVEKMPQGVSVVTVSRRQLLEFHVILFVFPLRHAKVINHSPFIYDVRKEKKFVYMYCSLVHLQ